MTNLPRWDLTDFYASIDAPEVAADLQRLASDAKEFAEKFDGKIESLSAQSLAAVLVKYENISELAQKLGAYASLQFAADMLDEKISKFYQDVFEALTEVESDLVFFSLALNRIDDKILAGKMAESKTLAKYAPWLRDLRASKPHQLSDELEKFEVEKSTTSRQAWIKLFDETHANLKYEFDGEALSNAEIFDKMKSADRAVREKAARAVEKTLGENANLFAAVTNNLAKDKAVSDKWRNFKAPISSRNLDNLVEDEVVDALQNTVKENYANLAHRYFKLKAKWMGLDKLEYWDRNAPLDEVEEDISAEEAQEIVLDAYEKFSPKMAELGKKFFDNDWIDWPPAKGKDSGAFAHPCVPSLHPYLLLNYQNKVDDVMTLAHELGHGVHQVLAAEQGTLMCDTPLTLAETASVFGEQLVFRAMLEKVSDPLAKRNMIAGKVEDMLNTVVRQIAFCEFERQVHDARKDGELSVTQLGEIWMQAQKDSLGDAFNYAPEYSIYWSYIPHFIHTPFYVYAYAFGDCLVNSLYAAYQSGEVEDFEEKYIEMLRAGGTLRHKELLAPFGLDASQPDFWQGGLDVIAGFIDELESACK